MTPPYKVELWRADGSSQLLNYTMSVESAERVVSEHVGQFGPKPVDSLPGAQGAIVFSKRPKQKANPPCQLAVAVGPPGPPPVNPPPIPAPIIPPAPPPTAAAYPNADATAATAT